MCSIVCAEYLHHALQIVQAFQALHSFAACWLGLLWHGTLCRVTWCHCRVTCTAGEVGAKKNCGTSTTHQTALGKCASIPTRSKLEQTSNRTNTVIDPCIQSQHCQLSAVSHVSSLDFISDRLSPECWTQGSREERNRKPASFSETKAFYHHKKHRLV